MSRVVRSVALLFGFALVGAARQGAAEAVADQAPAPSVVAPRVEATLTIDGALDEPVWAHALLLEGFRQYQPVDGRAAEERTEVRLFYTPSAICFGIRAYDSQPDTVRATVADRDSVDADDTVTIYLDTFNDRRRAFFFTVNPLGVQEDGVLSEGNNTPGELTSTDRDRNPDFLFESRGRRTTWGYEVELRIPFKSLRYPSGDAPQRWGLNVGRSVRRSGYVDTWTDVRRANASFLAQAGTLEGLHDLQRGMVFEAQPFTTATLDGQRTGGGTFERGDVDPSAGVNVRLGLSPDVSIDSTWNPDFSQVESDVGQVSVNERFALFFPEKRPFFLESIDLFATPNRLVYTRTVIDPQFGAKLTLKRGRFNVAHLTALDDTADGQAPRALFNATRLRSDVGRGSTVGATFTHRTQDDDSNAVLAADARILFGKLYYVLGQVGGSHTTRSGRSLDAPLWRLEFDRTGRAWGFNYSANGIGRDFQAAAGYVPRSDLVEASAFNRVALYGARGSLAEQLTLFAGPTRRWHYDDFTKRRALEGSDTLTALMRVRGGWELQATFTRDFVHFDAASFASYSVATPTGVRPLGTPAPVDNTWTTFLRVDLPTWRLVDGHVQAQFGSVPIFQEGARGARTLVGLVFNVRPTGALRIGASLAYVDLRRARDDSEFARVILPRLKLEYQARRALFVRLIGEYRSQRAAALAAPDSGLPLLISGVPATAQAANGLHVDALLSYEPRPGTVAFLGYGAGLDNGARFGFGNLQRTNDGFFVKLAYQFRR